MEPDHERMPIKSSADLLGRRVSPAPSRTGGPRLSYFESDMIREDFAQEDDIRMRKHWESEVCKCKGLNISKGYRDVAVLIIRWDKDLIKDLDCDGEVKELEELFGKGFGYNTRIVTLKNKKRPQVQLDAEIASFVAEHDGHHRSTLMIVYYTGHGYMREIDGKKVLFISGEPVPTLTVTDSLYPPIADWNLAETTLGHAEADVLIIADCCFAGCLMKGWSDSSRSYELMSASDDVVTGPGPNSYTRALIDSLREVLKKDKEGVYTTYLNQMIRLHKTGDGHHDPHVWNRLGNPTSRSILLAPLAKREDQPVVLQTRSAGNLTIQFGFSNHSSLTQKEVEKLARAICLAAEEAKLGIQAIDWLKFRPFKYSTYFNCVLLVVKAMRRWRLKKTIRVVDAAKAAESKKRLNDGEGDGDGQDLKRVRLNVTDAGDGNEQAASAYDLPTPMTASRGSTPKG